VCVGIPSGVAVRAHHRSVGATRSHSAVHSPGRSAVGSESVCVVDRLLRVLPSLPECDR
jgi:hypothetical protein